MRVDLYFYYQSNFFTSKPFWEFKKKYSYTLRKMSLQCRPNFSEVDISFDMERLFDPYNFDHIPIVKRLDLFKKRDLAHIKHYKAAVKIFGGPQKRTRAIIAPPMETPFKHRLGHYHNVVSQPPSLILNGSLKTPPVVIKEPSEQEQKCFQEREKRSNYKSWIEKRKRLRLDLENLALSESLLSRKANKSELEKRVQAKFRSARLWKPDEPSPPDQVPAPKPLPDVPRMSVPPPDGLQILDKFLSLNHMRLMDLFLLADKDKSWTISRQKFISLVQQSNIPLSETEIDDLIITLDSDLDDQLNYQELNKGLTEWRKQRRALKRQNGEDCSSCTSAGSYVRTNSSGASFEKIKSREANIPEQERPGNIISEDETPIRKESGCSQNQYEDNTMQRRDLLDTTVIHKTTGRRSQTEGIEHESEQISDHESRYLTKYDSKNQPMAFVEKITLQDHVQKSDNYLVTEYHTVINGEDKTFSDQTHEVKTIIFSENSRPMSHKTNASSRTHSSTPNTLEPPELDLRQEARIPESPEAMLDIRKHDQVVLRRNSMKKNMSVDQRMAFDEIPGVIKVGYKPIDDHCSESTLSGPVSKMVNQFRREKLKEYFEVIKMFEDIGLPLTQKTLDRVLLYPGDHPTNAIKNRLSIPSGPLRNEWSPIKKNKTKKIIKKNDREKQHSPASDMVNPSLTAPVTSSVERSRGPGVGQDAIESKDEDEDVGHSKRSRSKHTYVTVEQVYPMASKVKPKVTEEDLSSGVALIKRKVDNWMTFEEYSKYTRNLQKKFQHINHKSNPNAIWSGHLLDKIRLCMDYHPQGHGPGSSLINRESCGYEGIGEGLYNGRGNAVFYETTKTKRVYPGYNNDLLTWPVGENGVRYGSIDEHRIIK
ncbi:unnamed protein product [Lymnaea stagnalis]|uniref:EF-hand domain-containing protein n=1 Tax=Lymnaea stagnalis TaxID=6523 RepID=A0AAV2H080_LYMST